MRSIITIGGLLVLLTACDKKADPAYLAEIEKGAEALCKCVTLAKDEQVACMGKAGSVHPKAGPDGEPPGIYEEKLDDESKSKIDALRKKHSSCEAQIMAD